MPEDRLNIFYEIKPILIILFSIFGIVSYGLYLYNLVTVSMHYGAQYFWQPLVSNVHSLGFGTLYLWFAYLLMGRKKNYDKLFCYLFLAFGIVSYSLYFYNLIAHPLQHGIQYVWKPLFNNINYLGFGLIYFCISYFLFKKRMIKQTESEEEK